MAEGEEKALKIAADIFEIRKQEEDITRRLRGMRREKRRLLRNFRKEFRRQTGISIREAEKASWWMKRCEPHAEAELFKCDLVNNIKTAATMPELAKKVRLFAYKCERAVKMMELGKHEKLLIAARAIGLLQDWQVKAIIDYYNRCH